MSSELYNSRVVAALKNGFIADALAMPVHWYYKPADILRDFPGGVQQFESAPSFHPSSIMSLHSTSEGGRAKASKPSSNQAAINIVGDVILKGKRQYWTGANQHYHQGMEAGENTLNAHCARVALRASAGIYQQDAFLDGYIKLLCSDEPAHPDTYAESYHRGFFANLAAGKPANDCGAVTHDTASIGGLVTIGPVALSCALKGNALNDIQRLCRNHLYLTHPSEDLGAVCDDYVELLYRLLYRSDESPLAILENIALRGSHLSLIKLVAKNKSDIEIVGHQYSPACYISDAWPSVLYFAYRYVEDGKKALTANTNVGGDNVHRGFVLGTIMGLIEGEPIRDMFEQLADAENIEYEIQQACKNE
ncbi:ADP-ribosylglycohydrolase family protein [Alteromonas sp. 1_MG-2023]|uniref:ADP-ribosylglycohydrolase family protein n=1 Tax=Alteromonas sp. 1_MG-2023 TaxID=3062669 RepID=UPI0026E17104|nr:ADP-ribosylglycohydrolase family protein [Alteromonas sp. 1_MG-2023]MDO6567305.1 ADP-ribosylglycohydrolase family protein [Alteromonas sp. 1_MG-2023]